MDWSADNPHTLPTPHVPPSEHVLSPHVPPSEHVLSPHVSFPQGGSSGSNVSEMSSFNQSLLNYSSGQPSDASS